VSVVQQGCSCKFEPIGSGGNGFPFARWRSFPRFLAFGALPGLFPAALPFGFFLLPFGFFRLPLGFGPPLPRFVLQARLAQSVQLRFILFELAAQPPLVQAQVLQRFGFGHFGLGVQEQTLNGRVRVLL
jgi:hypothetical protein